MTKCPRCKTNELHEREPMNALSRRDNKTYICSPCGENEAMFDFQRSKGMMTIDRVENERAWLKEAKNGKN